MNGSWVRAIRGATTVAENSSEEIRRATRELLQMMSDKNHLTGQDIISIIFTVTDDLDATFPAEAARELGWNMVPLLCAREIPVPGSLRKCVRVLMHAYLSCPRDQVCHVYLGRAANLRPDLQNVSDDKKG